MEPAITRIPKLGYYRFKNCSIGPFGLILDESGGIFGGLDLVGDPYTHDVIAELASDSSRNHTLLNCGGQENVSIREVDFPIISFVRKVYQVYGHWILDCLPSLWWIFELERRGHFDLSKYRVALPSKTPSWALEILSLLFPTIKSRLFIYDEDIELVRSKEMIVPSMLRFGDHFSPLINEFANFVVKSVAGEKKFPEFIYISRTGVKSWFDRRIANEDQLDELASIKGYYVCDPARMSWPDQINMFAHARVIAGPYGSECTTLSSHPRVQTSSCSVCWEGIGYRPESPLHETKSYYIFVHPKRFVSPVTF